MSDKHKPITATWYISLYCYCPACGDYVDLLDVPDFWDGRQLAAGESHTERSRGVEVSCPGCGSEFEADLEY